ncbi:MAG: SDR family oxidoreductase [Oscillospiraceae bacterium]|nr:SDR family oxidoreductase [Oscillospiraceae bacterium]
MGKLAIVTGTGRGIGYGIAIRMAGAGYDIVGTYRSSAAGAGEVQEKIRAMGRKCDLYPCDISKMGDIESFWKSFGEEHGRVDVLINNAGVTRGAPFLEMTEEIWDTVNLTDWKGTYFMAQHGARLMVKAGVKGVIINISSNHMTGCWPNSTAYSGAKAAVSKFGTNAAMELAKYGIRVVTIAPGYTINRSGGEMTPEIKERMATTGSKIPIHRFGTPDEVGGACVFLAGDDAGYITGATLFMDGGALLPNLPSFREW